MDTRNILEQKEIKKGFKIIPGVGDRVAGDLIALGYKKVEDLKDEDPQKMYDKLCKLAGMHIDRCMLYVFRCAVYFAKTKKHNPELLKWWNWKDSPKKRH